MLYKLENLIQCLNATQQFTKARVDREHVFGDVLHKLKAISESLHSRRLGIQILGRFPLLAQGFCHSLGQSQAIQQAYQIEISEFPTISQLPQQRSVPQLILLANAEAGQQENHYELLPNQNILVGRDSQRLSQDLRSQNAQIIALSSYSRISSVHAQIQAIASPGASVTRWQICDFDSTNGTYVNGQKIKGCQALNSGDKITRLFRNQYAGKNAFNGFTRLLAFWTILNCSWRTFAYGILKSQLLWLILLPAKKLQNSFFKLLPLRMKMEKCSKV